MNRARLVFLWVPLLLVATLGCWPEDGESLIDDPIPVIDRDGDGTPDQDDGCPDDPSKIEPGRCGCGVADTDSDGDGTPDCYDACPDDPDKIEPGVCGCGVADADSDGDGTPDCLDPNEAPELDCLASYFDDDEQADDEFAACFLAEGRAGVSTNSNSQMFKLGLSAVATAHRNREKFKWQNGNEYPFALVWNGAEASFEVAGIVVRDSFICDSIDALQLRCRADVGSAKLYNLVLNDLELAEQVEVGGEQGGSLQILQLVCDFDDEFTLTGTVQFTWDSDDKPKKSKFAFGIAVGRIEIEPLPDCNENGIPDEQDIADGTSADCDADGVPDECQSDSDGDGVIDPCDACPDDPEKTDPGACGCNASDVDRDGDGTPDCNDGCPDDPDKIEPGVCGCGVPDTDGDGDGTPDCLDTDDGLDCEVSYFGNDGHAGQGFDGCFTAVGRIGNAAFPWHNYTYELDLSDGMSASGKRKDFPWQRECEYDFTLTWDGAEASFEVGGVVIEGSFACDPINALQFRCRANKGSIKLYNLVINGQPIDEVVEVSAFHPGNRLRIMRLVCDFDNEFVLTGTVEFDWGWFHRPRNSQLGFQIAAGTVQEQEPPADCNDNGVPDDEDIASGTSQDCNDNGIPDECDIADGTSADCDGNDVPDECQADGDGDGVIDPCDGCPEDPDKIEPGECGCGVPDTDTDGDGTPDCNDQCPNDPDKIEPGECGCGVPDTDTDGDGTPDCNDQCPNDPDKIEPGACGCGVPDTDTDGDGTPDCNDQCPNDPDKIEPGACGCGVPDTDTDGDGVLDCNDGCPNDPDKIEPGECGCGVPDVDTDGDGVLDCNDECPNDPDKIEPGECGCGVPDTDTDGDGTPDCNDQCPNDPDKIEPGECGCGVPDTDTDGDGTPDCNDQCPNDPGKTEPGGCGCGVPDVDTDGDGVLDCNDLCPDTPLGAEVDEFGCEDVEADAGADVVLENVGLVVLQGSASGGLPPYAYAWSAPDWDGSDEQNPTVMPAATTTYTLMVTDSLSPPKIATDIVTITITPPEGLQYTIVNIDAVTFHSSYPYGINDAGEVVGYYQDAAWQKHAFLYSNGTTIDLGTLGGTNATAHDINNAGQVVGESTNANGFPRAFLWDSDSGMQDLGTLGGAIAVGYAVNEFGDVAGYSENAAGYHAFLYAEGVMGELGTQAYLQSGAFDLNDAGQVVGVLVDYGGNATAFIYEDGTLNDLGTPLLSQSQAWVINNAGLVAGTAWGVGEDRSFLCADGMVIDLGALNGFPKTYAFGINDAGQVVGTAGNATGTLLHAAIYTGGELLDLNDLLIVGHGWDYLAEAFSINNEGQIVGYGVLGGEYRGFILTPVP